VSIICRFPGLIGFPGPDVFGEDQLNLNLVIHRIICLLDNMKMLFKISNKMSMVTGESTGLHKIRMSCYYRNNRYSHSRCFTITYYILSFANWNLAAYSQIRIGLSTSK